MNEQRAQWAISEAIKVYGLDTDIYEGSQPENYLIQLDNVRDLATDLAVMVDQVIAMDSDKAQE